LVRYEAPKEPNGSYVVHYNHYDSSSSNGKIGGEKRSFEVDAIVGADGANSRVAKDMGAGDYEYAIAFQERVKIPDDPKCDHVAVGTGTVTHKADIKKFQAATRLRAKDKIEGGKIIRVEAHPIPEHPRPKRYHATMSFSSRCKNGMQLPDMTD
jgi:geranylgeranyl reductase